MPVKGKLPSRVKTPTREREKMAKKIAEYRDTSKFTEGDVIVETFIASGEHSNSELRVRPIPSEGFDPDIRVQWSRKIRNQHPVGTKFKIYLFLRKVRGRLMLSANNSTDYEVVDTDDSELVAQAKENSEFTDDFEKLNERCGWFLKNPAQLKTMPTGNEQPRRTTRPTNVVQRSPKVAAWVRHNSGGKCELCEHEAPFKDKSEFPFLEVHHVVFLANGGPDTITNAVAVCPNCHRALHLSNKAVALRDELYEKVGRLLKI